MIINNRRALYVAYTFIEIIAVNQYTKKRGERATSGGLMDTLKGGGRAERKGRGKKSSSSAIWWNYFEGRRKKNQVDGESILPLPHLAAKRYNLTFKVS